MREGGYFQQGGAVQPYLNSSGQLENVNEVPNDLSVMRRIPKPLGPPGWVPGTPQLPPPSVVLQPAPRFGLVRNEFGLIHPAPGYVRRIIDPSLRRRPEIAADPQDRGAPIQIRPPPIWDPEMMTGTGWQGPGGQAEKLMRTTDPGWNWMDHHPDWKPKTGGKIRRKRGGRLKPTDLGGGAMARLGLMARRQVGGRIMPGSSAMYLMKADAVDQLRDAASKSATYGKGINWKKAALGAAALLAGGAAGAAAGRYHQRQTADPAQDLRFAADKVFLKRSFS